jgi:hypothetical protein
VTVRLDSSLSLPLQIAGEATAILAKRGAGKTNAAKVIVEGLLAEGVQVVILDPVGVWWGLRSLYDIPVIGGRFGDLPLEQTAGKMLADVVVDSRQSLVLDVSGLDSDGRMQRFAYEFGERLYTAKQAQPSPTLLVLEEADEFAPQDPRGTHVPRMIGAFVRIVKRGRSRGLGILSITQRSAGLSKNVLEQSDTLILMRTTGRLDRKAIEDWIKYQQAEGADQVIPSLAGLQTGEAWVWTPERALLQRVQIEKAKSHDTSKTPEHGDSEERPRDLRPIDLEALGQRMKETVERAKANDPDALRQQIKTLERDLAAAKQAPAERVEIPIEVERILASVRQTLQPLVKLDAEFSRMRERLSDGLAAVLAAVEAADGQITLQHPPARQVPAQRQTRPDPRPAPPARQPQGSPNGSLPKAERLVLAALAPYGTRTVRQVALLAGYSHKGGGFRNALGSLRRQGYIEGLGTLTITDAGVDALGTYDPLPTGRDLLDHWLAQPLLGKAEREILLVLYDTYPDPLSADEIAARTESEYSASGGGFRNALGKLRSLELIEGRGSMRASPDLMDA